MRYAILLVLTLAACSPGGLRAPDDSPYAPYGIASGEAVPDMEVGHRLMLASEYELALRAFTRAAGQEGLTPDVLVALGTANLGLGRLNQAERLLRDAQAKDEDNPVVLNNLGVVLMERGKTLEASQVFRRAFALDPEKSPQIRDNLRKSLAKLDNPGYTPAQDEAVQLVRRGSSDYVIAEYP